MLVLLRPGDVCLPQKPISLPPIRYQSLRRSTLGKVHRWGKCTITVLLSGLKNDRDWSAIYGHALGLKAGVQRLSANPEGPYPKALVILFLS